MINEFVRNQKCVKYSVFYKWYSIQITKILNIRRVLISFYLKEIHKSNHHNVSLSKQKQHFKSLK